ncbi:MAG: hypothetical protein H0T61_01980 [Actinobacteria bacterium]|nr:hypothetical protein [Actinomycetota bacterium]
METVIPGLHASAPAQLPFDTSLAIRVFLLQRPSGNLLVYRSEALERESDTVRELGGVARQDLNHRHEVGTGTAATVS